MPFESKKPPLELSQDVRTELTRIAKARTEAAHRVERATIMLAYADGEQISNIARLLSTNRVKVNTCINKALVLGALEALEDLPRSGRTPTITAEARTWLVALACTKPTDHGYSLELWTQQLLATHARQYCIAAGHPSLAKIAKGTVWKILKSNDLRPHKISYYLEGRDPNFNEKMAEVLFVYHTVSFLGTYVDDTGPMVVNISVTTQVSEKPESK